jgi:hypothetical protein
MIVVWTLWRCPNIVKVSLRKGAFFLGDGLKDERRETRRLERVLSMVGCSIFRRDFGFVTQRVRRFSRRAQRDRFSVKRDCIAPWIYPGGGLDVWYLH